MNLGILANLSILVYLVNSCESGQSGEPGDSGGHRIKVSYLISSNSLLLENIAYDGPFKHIVFVIVFVFVFVSVFVIVIADPLSNYV